MDYYIHDNGGRSFKVKIFSDKTVNVYPDTGDYDANGEYQMHFSSKPLYTWKVDEVFLPKSHKNPFTSFGGGYGERFHNNQILLRKDKNSYIFIGSREIITFKTTYPIVAFLSPVGNNDVPYPYAIDENGYMYDLVDHVRVYIHPFDILNGSELREKPKKFKFEKLFPIEKKKMSPRRKSPVHKKRN